MGSPAGPQNVEVTVDTADIGAVIVTADWDGGSTFNFICINGGRIIGVGGAGGNGGDDNGSSGTAGSDGTNGTPALQSDGFVINVDIDDGYLLGGGGGGGGGSYEDTGANGTPGGGGGGGQGFFTASGGLGGNSIGLPPAADGGDGSQGGPGGGGTGGGPSVNDGGDGGAWGAGGYSGDFATPGILSGTGGLGSRAGNAFLHSNSGSIVYSGVSSEAILRTEERIVGETFGYPQLPDTTTYMSNGATRTGGWNFLADTGGTLTLLNSFSGNFNHTNAWFALEDPILANYEIRDVPGTREDSWSSTPTGSEGDWRVLSSQRDWEQVGTGPQTTSQVFEIRLVGSSGILDSGFLRVINEGP